MHLKKSDLFWLVGLWEGEGCFYLTNASYEGKKNTYPAMSIEMNDEDIIKRCADLMEKPYAATNHGTFRLTSSGKKAAPWIYLFYPYLGKRRQEKITSVFERSTHDYSPILIEDDD